MYHETTNAVAMTPNDQTHASHANHSSLLLFIHNRLLLCNLSLLKEIESSMDRTKSQQLAVRFIVNAFQLGH